MANCTLPNFPGKLIEVHEMATLTSRVSKPKSFRHIITLQHHKCISIPTLQRTSNTVPRTRAACQNAPPAPIIRTPNLELASSSGWPCCAARTGRNSDSWWTEHAGQQPQRKIWTKGFSRFRARSLLSLQINEVSPPPTSRHQANKLSCIRST